jgi:hypothetical protein
MRLPAQFSPLDEALSTHFGAVLTPGQRRDLAAWVAGTLLAGSACLTLVVTALVETLALGRWHRVRQALQEFLLDGAARSSPCLVQLTPEACFAPLLGWVLSLWRSRDLALAVDVTTHQDRLTAIVISVLYRGRALPVAWQILPGNQPGAYLPPLLRLLDLLAPQTRHLACVTLAADQGLWSPTLYAHVCRWGWHPLARVHRSVWVWLGRRRHVRADQLVPGPGHAWVGRATVHKDPQRQRRLTVMVVWAHGYDEPWVIFTDLAPRVVGVAWYALRFWIELGFRDLKRLGWQWERTRRLESTRVARHWLVLAIATLWALATGTAADDAARPRADGTLAPRPVSTFQRGRAVWLGVLTGCRPLPPLVLRPDPWPDERRFPGLTISYWHDPDAPAPQP